MYKTVLVHVDATARAAARIEVAARLAMAHEACLIGAATAGVAPVMVPVGGLDPGMPFVTYPYDDVRADAQRALAAFELQARQAGLEQSERRLAEEEPGIGISMAARYADVVVLSQSARGETLPQLRADFPEYVLLNSARPVLVLPAAGVRGQPGQRVAVAWNGSTDAVRAVTSAVALLRSAQRVDLVVFNASGSGAVHGPEPGADMALNLARHGVRVEVVVRETERDPGHALLAYASDNHIDLIVMGAYGHSRFREILLGGVTRTVLRESSVPLWMAH